jgi:hypothetical protein
MMPLWAADPKDPNSEAHFCRESDNSVLITVFLEKERCHHTIAASRVGHIESIICNLQQILEGLPIFGGTRPR